MEGRGQRAEVRANVRKSSYNTTERERRKLMVDELAERLSIYMADTVLNDMCSLVYYVEQLYEVKATIVIIFQMGKPRHRDTK